MKPYTDALLTTLRSRSTCWANCWKITRKDGQIFAYTEHDANLTINGQLYKTTNSFTASATKSSTDMSVDNIEAQAVMDDDEISERDLKGGLYDFADIIVFGCDFRNPEATVMPVRKGKLGEVKIMPPGFTVEVRSLLQALQQTIGRKHTLECDADLFDSRCKVNPAAYTVTGTIEGGGGNAVIDTSRNEAEDYFKYGLFTWTSGQNAGLKSEVKKFKNGIFYMWDLMVFPVASGDTYSVTAGCDKTFSTCKTKFSATLNFRGFHLMPTQDQVFNYPDAD